MARPRRRCFDSTASPGTASRIRSADLVNVQLARSEPQPALASYEERVTLLDRLTSADPTRTDLQAHALGRLPADGRRAAEGGEAEDALVWADKDLATYGDVSAIERADPGRQRDLASSYDRRAQALRNLGRKEEARDLFRKATTLLDRVIDGNDRRPKLAARCRDDARGAWERCWATWENQDGALEQYQAGAGNSRAAGDLAGISGLVERTHRRLPKTSAKSTLRIDRVSEAHEMAEQYLLAAAFNTDVDKAERIRRALGTVCWYGHQ